MKPPLKQPYDEPYPVVNREPKYYLVKETEKNISIDRLKAAFLPQHSEQQESSKQTSSLNNDDEPSTA